MKLNTRKAVCKIAAALILIILIISFGGGVFGALAETATEYSDVLEDLQTDENFDEDEYPTSSTDFTISVIQIAESSDGELFVYTYQPYNGSLSSYDMTATSINISTGVDNNLKYINYTLTLLSNTDTLYKYLVNKLTVSSASTRYYCISSIYRAYYEGIDGATSDDNTVSETAYEVGQKWAVETANDGSVSYTMVEDDVVVITDKYVGTLRYYGSVSTVIFATSLEYFDSHYIAFSTDRDIDRLYEADVYFVTQEYERTTWYSFSAPISDNTEYGSKTDNTVTLSYTDSTTRTGGGIFAKTYTWDRIQTAEDFISSEDDLTSAAVASVSGKQWVLRFYESEWSVSENLLLSGVSFVCETESGTTVSDVTILRLKFETDGVTYNLGVVDNKTNSSGRIDNGGNDDDADNSSDLWKKIKDFFESLFNFDVSGLDAFILAVKWIVVIVVGCLLVWLIMVIYPFIKIGIKAICKAIAAPFKKINNAIKSRNNKKDKDG